MPAHDDGWSKCVLPHLRHTCFAGRSKCSGLYSPCWSVSGSRWRLAVLVALRQTGHAQKAREAEQPKEAKEARQT